MNEATLGILLELRDNATAQLRTVNAGIQDLKKTSVTPGGIDTSTAQMKGLGAQLSANKMLIRELAMGTMYLGSTFLGLGAAMQSSNNQSLKSFGSMVMLVGGIMTAIGSAVQFISAISKMVDALRKLQIAQILAQAFSGPAGWAALAIGGAVAAGAVYSLSKYESAQTKATKDSTAPTQVISVTQHIAGSVTTERQLIDNVHRGLLLKEQRSYQTGIK